ncbi:hypothetical protein NL676_033972 [Syzygium grande]|nr:hypothetical protein NL676_033972 [Syzygium grande]
MAMRAQSRPRASKLGLKLELPSTQLPWLLKLEAWLDVLTSILKLVDCRARATGGLCSSGQQSKSVGGVWPSD